MNVLPPRPNLVDCYECPNQVNFDPYEEHYKHPSYKERHANPHRNQNRKKVIPEVVEEPFAQYGYDWDYPQESDYRHRMRPDKPYETLGSTHLSNSFYRCDFPNKIHKRSYNSHASDYQIYAVDRPNNPERMKFRQPSGYTNTDYMEVPHYNRHDCYADYKPRAKYSPEYDSEWMYNPIPNLRNKYYPEPTSNYDNDYDDNREMPRSSFRKKSVEFLGVDCEIPYNILTRKKNVSRKHKQCHEYPQNCSGVDLLSVDIPFKERKQKRFLNYDYEPYRDRPESGYDYYDLAKPVHRNIDYNSDYFGPNCKCHRKKRKSLKEKISGLFKIPKPRYGIQCKPQHHSGGREERSVSSFNNILSCKAGMHSYKSVSNASRIIVSTHHPRAWHRKQVCYPTSNKKTRCNVYPTVYRVMREKVNNPELDSAMNDELIMNNSEYCRRTENRLPPDQILYQNTVIAKETCSRATAKADASHSCIRFNNQDVNSDAGNDPNDTEEDLSVANSVIECTNNCCKQNPEAEPVSKPNNEPETPFAPKQPSNCSLSSSSIKQCRISEPRSLPFENKVSYAQLHSGQQKSDPSDHKDSQRNISKPTIPNPSNSIEKLTSTPQLPTNKMHPENDYGSVRNYAGYISPNTGSHTQNYLMPKTTLSTCISINPNSNSLHNIIENNSSLNLESAQANAVHCQVPNVPTKLENGNVEPVRVSSKPQLESQDECCNSAQPKDASPSYLEELKMELLSEMENEHRLNVQLPYLKPTPQIVIFPCCPSNLACPAYPTIACYMNCWKPL